MLTVYVLLGGGGELWPLCVLFGFVLCHLCFVSCRVMLISVLLCFVLLFVLFVLIVCWFICFVLFASWLVHVVLVGGCVACCLCGLLVLFCVARPVLIGVAAGHITILINATEFVHHSRPVIIVVTI